LDPADLSVPAFLVALGPLVGYTAGVGLFGFFFQALALGIAIIVSDALEHDERIGLAQAWRRLTPRLGNLFATSGLVVLIAVGVLLAGAMLFFLIVPLFAAVGLVVYLLVLCSVAPTVVVSLVVSLGAADPSGVTPTWLYLVQGIAGALVQNITASLAPF
jgi:hypothetical protein